MNCLQCLTRFHGSAGFSKYAVILWTRELQRRLNADNVPITVITLHPGTVNTFAYLTPFPRFAEWVFGFFMKTPDEGAWPSLFAAASPLVRTDRGKFAGAYLSPDRKVVGTAKGTEDPETAKQLWNTTEKVLENLGV